MRFFIGVVPWFVPGMVLSTVVSTLAGRDVARCLRTRGILAWAMLMAFGLVLSATVTPLHEALEFGAIGAGVCDFSRVGLIPLSDLGSLNDTSLNVVMLVPLGVAVGLLPRSRAKVVVLGLAVALPPFVEFTQLVVPQLDRACQSADVFDNLTGLVVGLAAGSLLGWLVPELASRGEPSANQSSSDESAAAPGSGESRLPPGPPLS